MRGDVWETTFCWIWCWKVHSLHRSVWKLLCSMPMLVSLEKNTSPTYESKIPQTETLKWIMFLKISFFFQSQNEAGNTYMPLGSLLGKKILMACKIFSKKSIICLVICFYCSDIKKKSLYTNSGALHWVYFEEEIKECFFHLCARWKEKTNVFHPKKENTWELSKISLAKFFFFFFLFTKQHGKSEVEMVNEQISSGFRKAWFLGNKGLVRKTQCFSTYGYPHHLWVSVGRHWEPYSCLLLPLLPGQWEKRGVPARGTARQGWLSQCRPLTSTSLDARMWQPRAHSGGSWVFVEEQTSPGCIQTCAEVRGEEAKPVLRLGLQMFCSLWVLPLHELLCFWPRKLHWGKVALFSQTWIDSAVFLLLAAEQFPPTASSCPPTGSSPCQWSVTSSCYLLKTEQLLARNRKLNEEVSHLRETARSD